MQTSQRHTIEVRKIKCRGCAHTVQEGLLGIEGVAHIVLDLENGRVSLDGAPAAFFEARRWLDRFGFLPRGTEGEGHGREQSL